MTIIPAIDIIDGKCVRLTQGRYDRAKVYYPNPLDAARSFEDCGLTRLHVVDLDGAKASFPQNLHTLESIVASTRLDVEFGGGIKDTSAIKAVFDAGAKYAICGSIAVTRPELMAQWLDVFSPQRIILGADARGGKIATHGWLQDSDVSVDALISKFEEYGLMHAICTDIAVDGMLCGPDVAYYAELQSRHPKVEIIVSGGISSVADIKALSLAGLESVIVGKAIYEGKISLNQLKLCSQNA